MFEKQVLKPLPLGSGLSVMVVVIAKDRYPEAEHVFVYDNVTTHTKRRDDVANIVKMTLGPSSNIGDVIETCINEEGVEKKIRVRFSDTHFPDGSTQYFYWPGDHPIYGAEATKSLHGQFKGIAQLLLERGTNPAGLKLTCKSPQRYVANTHCCVRQVLSKQPGFIEQQSALEEIAEADGCRLLFLPKFHCELNPIEQCWGCAKRVYR
ncbi:DDE superfamily endonuclease [Rhizoctonia solani]|uniref:DDE superfamily endonuclease n=1 Tax=Rhizoctonia solani TaxID=456999 RepID=A0A8H8P5Z1_9AGAM|nr:DDE superfamily endonuclease [Rhizoctonia solani]QRW24428.1 DDE superfamily endonuclease [Rhizoctonia solani]